MTILVTGGAGYIGSHTSAALLRAGHDIVILDNLSTGHAEAVPQGARLVVGDLADIGMLRTLFGRTPVTAILHFAAHSLAGESMTAPFAYLRDNCVNLLNLVQVATEAGAPPFVLSSTANLFDQPDKLPIDEDCPVIPGSPYGESKQFAERVLHWTQRTHGLRAIRLRYFNAAGADPQGQRGEDHEPETHLIPRLLQVALGQRPYLEIFGNDYDTPDGTCVRDYIHVADLAAAHLLAVEALLRGGESRAYNLGSGTGYSVLQVIETARAITGHPIPVRWGPRRAGDPARLVAGSDRIRRELGWQPQWTDLPTILSTAWDWHRRHPHGFAAPQATALAS